MTCYFSPVFITLALSASQAGSQTLKPIASSAAKTHLLLLQAGKTFKHNAYTDRDDANKNAADRICESINLNKHITLNINNKTHNNTTFYAHQ